MKGSGKTDSSGEFTISPDKAREKLAQYLLNEPRHYVLNVVSAAVRSGASKFTIEFNGGTTIITIPGMSLTAEELEGLLNQVIRPTEIHLQELGVALNALMALGPKSITVESVNGAEGHRYAWEDQRWSLAHLQKPEPTSKTRLIVEENRSIAQQMAATFSSREEQIVLRTRAQHSPCAIWLGRESVNAPISLGETSSSCLAWAHIHKGQSKLSVHEPRPNVSPFSQNLSDSLEYRGFEVVIALDFEADGEAENILFINDGVTFTRQPFKLKVPSIQAALVTSLKKDVSHTDLVNDSAYQGIIRQLNNLAEDILVERACSEAPLPDAAQNTIYTKMPVILQHLRRRRSDRLNKAQRWYAEMSFMKNLGDPQAWAALMDEVRKAKGEELEKLTNRLRKTLRQAARTALDAADYYRCSHLCQCLAQLTEGETEHQNLALIRGLLGTIESKDSYILCLLHRLSGQHEAALQIAPNEFSKAQILVALERFEKGRQHLRPLLERPVDQSWLLQLDLMADIHAFTNSERNLKRAFELKKTAYEKRSNNTYGLGNFPLQDLVRLSRGASPFFRYVSYQAQSWHAGAPKGQAGKTAAELEKAEKALQKKLTGGVVRVQSALLAVEKKFPLDHAFLELARSRAVHLLRRYGYWVEADQVLAKAEVLNHLYRYI